MERSRIILFDFTVHSTDFWNQENSDCENNSFHLSCCLVLKLNDLQSVNVGLFDQYFRITGEYVLCFKFFLFYILPQIDYYLWDGSVIFTTFSEMELCNADGAIWIGLQHPVIKVSRNLNILKFLSYPDLMTD